MSEVSDEPIKKLSDAITENNEIITDVNSLIKEMKSVKEVNDATYEKYKKSCDELIGDLDEIIDVIENCQQQDDPTLKSFDSKKKTAKGNTEKSKKQLIEALSKLEKTILKNKDIEENKKKGILKNTSKKEKVDSKDKKSENVKKDDQNSLAAGSSIIEDLDENIDDIESENELKQKNTAEKDDKVKDKSETGDIVIDKLKKEEDKDSKTDKDKKKEKDKSNKDKKDNKSKTKEKETVDKSKKGKEKTEKDNVINSKSGKPDNLSDNKSELSFVSHDEDDEDEEEPKEKETQDKKEEKSKSKKTKLNADEDKDKIKKNKKIDKNKKSHDSVSIGDTKEDTLVDNLDKNNKGKNIKSKIISDTDSINGKKDESFEEDKKKKSKKKSNKNSDEIEDLGTEMDISSKEAKKKKDKKKKSDQKLVETDSVKDKSEDSVSKDKKKNNKEKDKKSEDSEIKEKGKNVDKKIKEKDSKSKSKQPEEKSERKDNDNDKEVHTSSLRTQDSLKSESEYGEDFESGEEENKIMKKETTVESKVPETSAKPVMNLKKQHFVDSDEDDDYNNVKTEGELVASSKFENIDGPYIVIKPFQGESEDDLSCSVGDQLTILEINDDGWWLAKNENGDEGFVPISCLKPKRDSQELLDTTSKPGTSEDTIVSKESKTESNIKPNSEGKSLWNQIQQTMKEKGLTDVLKAFGALPDGFRFSTLAAWPSKNPVECSMKAYMCPKLSDSDLSFKDLQHDTVENKIRPRPVRIQRTVQIVKSFQMPVTNEKFVIKSRHLRMCLFNGEKAVSNIHTMRASVSDKDTKIWNFNSKITDVTNSLEFNEIFLRINHTSTEVYLLLEFCMLGFKTKSGSQIINPEEEVNNSALKRNSVKIIEEFSDSELVEFSVGWTKIPLYDENGQLITNKNSDYELFGGTPYEEGLEVDSNIGRTATGSKFKSLLSQSKQPQVSVRISVPNKENKELMETLPDIIIGSTLHLTNLSYYRRILCEELMDKRQNLTSAEPIYSPFLVTFMDITDSLDLLDVMRTIWIEKVKSLKNVDKKDYDKMNKIFKDTFIEYIYPLSKVKSLPQPNLARQDMEQTRSVKIKDFVQRVKNDKLSVLLSGDFAYAPLSFDEFSYKVVSKYSKAVKT